MITEDYILKLIRLATEFVAKALGLAKEGDFLTSEKTMDNGLQDLTGLGIDTLKVMDADTLKSISGENNAVVFVLAEFLQNLAEIEKIKGSLDLYYIYSKKALSLYLSIRNIEDLDTLEPIKNIYKNVKSTVYEEKLINELKKYFTDTGNSEEIEFLSSQSQ